MPDTFQESVQWPEEISAPRIRGLESLELSTALISFGPPWNSLFSYRKALGFIGENHTHCVNVRLWYTAGGLVGDRIALN